MLMNYKACLFFVLFFTFNNFVNADEPCEFIVGWENWAPYQGINDQHQLSGLDIELMSEIFKEIECKLTFKELPWERLLRSIKQGSVHAAMSVTVTDERKKWALFSIPYRTEKMVLFTRKDSLHQLSTLPSLELQDFQLGIRNGVHYGEEFSKLMQAPQFRAKVQSVIKVKQNIRKLARHRIDGFLDDLIATTQLIKDQVLTDQIVATNLTAISSNLSIMFSKKSVDQKLVGQFNQTLLNLKKSGKHQIILDKYLLPSN